MEALGACGHIHLEAGVLGKLVQSEKRDQEPWKPTPPETGTLTSRAQMAVVNSEDTLTGERKVGVQ